jgi:hypothetical protein
MSLAARAAALAVAIALSATQLGAAQAARPLPDREPLFTATRENLSRAQREQYRYAYKERRSDLHVNPFGSRVGTEGMRVYEVTPRPGNVVIRKLIERDGKPVTPSPTEGEQRRVARESSTGRPVIDDIVDTLDFRIDRRETSEGRDTIVVAFTPRPDAKPQTREGRIASKFKGEIWIDEAVHEVIRARATAIDDLSLGYGLVARLNEGTMATLTRAPVAGGVWLPTSVRVVGDGRAMLFFRKLTVDYVLEWFDYKRVL